LLYFIGSPFLFGYAKPVPVDWSKLRKPKRDMAWVALAGPAANIFMALLWLLFAIALVQLQINEVFFLKMAKAGVIVNLVIFAFNLFPLPPLDGGRIVTSILPNQYAYKFAQIEPYGFFILLALLYLNVLNFWMAPVMDIGNMLWQLVGSPITFY